MMFSATFQMRIKLLNVGGQRACRWLMGEKAARHNGDRSMELNTIKIVPPMAGGGYVILHGCAVDKVNNRRTPNLSLIQLYLINSYMRINSMSLGKNSLSSAILSILMGLAVTSCQSTPAYAGGGPGLSIQSEQMRHPRLVAAIQAMRGAYRELEGAPDNFGGRKAAAMHDVLAAIHSVKAALYYRLQMDDAAIDRIQE